MKNLTWQNPEQLFVAQELINKVKSKCCGIKEYYKQMKGPDDILTMRKAVCYLKEADKHAMLSLKGAATLLKLYNQYGGKGLEVIDDREENRLVKLSTMGFNDIVDSVEVDSQWGE